MDAGDSHDTRAGRFPEVNDQAPQSAPWLPWLGVGLLVVVVAYVVIGSAASNEATLAEEGAESGDAGSSAE